MSKFKEIVESDSEAHHLIAEMSREEIADKFKELADLRRRMEAIKNAVDKEMASPNNDALETLSLVNCWTVPIETEED